MAEIHPQLAPLYERIYERNDIKSTRGSTRVVLVIAGFWLLCGVINYLFLAIAFRDLQERAAVAFGFGPLFWPLDAGRGGAWIDVVGVDVPVLVVALVVGSLPVVACVGLLTANGAERSQWARQRRLATKYARRQNRLEPMRVIKLVGLMGPGLPLALVRDMFIGVPFGADRGHIAVIAPSRSGKGLHLTESLLAWPGAAVVVDPKSEQWERTAGYRALHVGPVYQLPHVGIDLLDFFNADDPLDVQELHTNLLRTWQDREPIFAEKSLPLFFAAIACSKVTKEHPLRMLARWSEMSAIDALREAAVHAPQRVAQFMDGDNLDAQATLNRFAQSAWGTFTTRFAPLVPHIMTVTTPDVPKDWIAQRATIYITYPLDQLETAGALVSAIFAACIKAQMRQPVKAYSLFALDELRTTALARLDTYIATIGGYGGMLLMYLQTSSQLDDVYGPHKARTIMGNCANQVFYPPRDPQTAEDLSQVLGTELRYTRTQNTSRSFSGGKGNRQTSVSYLEREEPVLIPQELTALPADVVIVLVQGAKQQYRVLAERLNPIPKLATLPPPPGAGRSVVQARVVSAEPAGETQARTTPAAAMTQHWVRTTPAARRLLQERAAGPVVPALQSVGAVGDDDQVQVQQEQLPQQESDIVVPTAQETNLSGACAPSPTQDTNSRKEVFW